MTGLHQAGQVLPTPSLSSFPGQPDTPLQEYPGMASPHQSPIPPEVLAAAQAAGLGIPIREYRQGPAASHPKTVGVPSVLVWTFLVVSAILLDTVPFPFNLLSAAIMAVSILPLLPMILRLTRSV